MRPAAGDAIRGLLDPIGGPVAGDPGRIHLEGMTARVAVEQAREQVATLVGARSREVVFTSGATESIAAATYGARERDPARTHVVLAAVEHSAVRQWAERGPHTVVGVDRTGRVDPDELLGAVRDDTARVHVQGGNHEVGTLQPVGDVVAACRERGVLVHVDAAQAVGRVPVDFVGLGADLLSVSGHKFGGPPGTGALLVRRGLRIPPLLVGGDQERARRAGMENTLGVVAVGAASEDAASTLADGEQRCRALTDRVRRWAATADGIDVVGAVGDAGLPHIVCVTFQAVEPQPVLLGLDQAGVAVHSGSSCSSESLEPSPVLQAMGVDAHRSLRISVGWDTVDADIDALLAALPAVLERLLALGRS